MANFLEKIFGKKNKQDDTVATEAPPANVEAVDQPAAAPPFEDETKPLSSPVDMIAAAPMSEGGFDPPQLIAGCAQSVGRQRDHNEDAMFCLSTTLATNSNSLPF